MEAFAISVVSWLLILALAFVAYQNGYRAGLRKAREINQAATRVAR